MAAIWSSLFRFFFKVNLNSNFVSFNSQIFFSFNPLECHLDDNSVIYMISWIQNISTNFQCRLVSHREACSHVMYNPLFWLNFNCILLVSMECCSRCCGSVKFFINYKFTIKIRKKSKIAYGFCLMKKGLHTTTFENVLMASISIRAIYLIHQWNTKWFVFHFICYGFSYTSTFFHSFRASFLSQSKYRIFKQTWKLFDKQELHYMAQYWMNNEK